jgi:hypothetical protein
MHNAAIRFAATLSATFLFLSGGAICAAASSLSGTVTHAENGAPIGGVKVEAFADIDTRPLAMTATDPHGRFSLRDLPAAEYHLLLHASQLFDTVIAGITLGPAEDRQLSNALSMEAWVMTIVQRDTKVDPLTQARLRGMAVSVYGDSAGESVTSRPIAGITVGVFRVGDDKPINWATTDEAGRFAFNFLPAGEYVVKQQSQGLVLARVTLPPGSSVLLASPLEIQPAEVDVYRVGPRDPCELLQPKETADVYVVCGNRLNY